MEIILDNRKRCVENAPYLLGHWRLVTRHAGEFGRSSETLSFTPNDSFQLCTPGSVCPNPGKMPENISFSPNFYCLELALGFILLLTRPALIKILPLPLRRFFGDLSDTQRILLGLDLKAVPAGAKSTQ